MFSRRLLNDTIFEKEVIEYRVSVLIFYIIYASNIFRIKKNWRRDMIQMYTGLHVKYPLFLSDFNEN